MNAKLILACGFVGLLLLALLGEIRFVMRNPDRFLRYRKNLFVFMALLVFISVLMDVLLPDNCWLNLLIIPIFAFGVYYIFYDAFLKN